jgi:molybdopterin-synthase adenylyltransferase
MREIVIDEPKLQALIAALDSTEERGAALYLTNAGDRCLVREIEVAGPDDRVSSSAVDITFAPQFLTRVTRRAREKRMHLAILHTHPAGYENFSTVDDTTEAGLAEFMHRRNPDHPSISMVLCSGTIKARRLGTPNLIPVRVVGRNIVFSPALGDGHAITDRFDRQVRAFGREGQLVLQSLKVAIVGLGGTGSVAAQQLAHLGVGSLILIDADTIEESNLNRVVGSNKGLVGKYKTDASATMIQEIAPSTRLEVLRNTAICEDGRRLLRAVDAIFICTDSHSSRAFLAELAYQYLIPAFDVGTSINAIDGRVTAVTGRTQMLAPGLPCLLCANALDARAIREELMTPEERAADPYFNSGGVHQPAVISLNSTMVSLAVTMFLAAFVGIPGKARWQSYDAVAGTVRVFGTAADSDCPVCGNSGLIAAGDSQPLTLLSATT